MILLSAVTSNGPKLAVKLPSGIAVLSEVHKAIPEYDLNVVTTVNGALSRPDGLAKVVRYVKDIAASKDLKGSFLAEKEVQLGVPFKPGSIICVGLNYKDHAKEGGVDVPERPVLFAKLSSCVVGPNEPIVLPMDTTEVDYEAELAVVIGRRCHRVAADEALDYVAGYTCMNDVSARDFQRGDGQWVRAKSQDTFGPIGPYLVTRDDVQDPQSLSIRCLVNGQLVQNSNTREMVFGVKDLITFISRGITLMPGDVISTGTPPGVGFARKPPLFLKDGDEVTVEVERVGRLSNPVRKTASDA